MSRHGLGLGAVLLLALVAGGCDGSPRDAGAVERPPDSDAPRADAGTPDAGSGDAGSGDAGSGDAGSGDAGSGDAGAGDAGAGDAGAGDAGSGDAGVALSCGDGAPVAGPGVRVCNADEGELLRHPLALLRGVAAPGSTRVQVSRGDEVHAWPVVAGQFKALVPLQTGPNALELRTDQGAATQLSLTYSPPTTPYFVRLVYLLSSDGTGAFDAPSGEPNDVASATQRLRLAGRLMQTFTAEDMRREGFGRRTFRLEEGADGEPVVHVLRLPLTTQEAWDMESVALWHFIYGALSGLPQREQSIDVVLLGMTHYDSATGRLQAHMALGGGHQAVFGSSGLHTWAPSLESLVERFSDTRRIDPAQLHDDSAGRATYWANYATGMGALLHELGHCLTLPHPVDTDGIMARGFDHLNRTFVMVEPESATTPPLSPIPPSAETRWGQRFATRLRYLPYLELSPQVRNATFLASLTPTEAVFSSSAGLRHVLHVLDGGAGAFTDWRSDPPPLELRVPLAELEATYPGRSQVVLSATDSEGHVTDLTVPLSP